MLLYKMLLSKCCGIIKRPMQLQRSEHIGHMHTVMVTFEQLQHPPIQVVARQVGVTEND